MGCCDYVYETRDKVTHSDPLKTVRDVVPDDVKEHLGVLYDSALETRFSLNKLDPLQDIENILDDPSVVTKKAFKASSDFIYDHRGAVGVITIMSFALGGPAAPLAFSDPTTALLAALASKEEANELNDVVTGRYADRQKHMQESKGKYDDKVSEYEKAMGALQDDYIIDDEIFQLAAINKAKRVQDKYIDELEALRADLNKQVEDFDRDFKHFQSILDHKYLKYLAWVPLVIGGFVSDVSDFITKGDYEAGRRALNIIVQVIGIIIAVVVTIVTWGSSAWITVPMIISIVTQLVALAMSLDGMYGQGLLMNGAFSMLDLILNEVLHLDDVWSELGTEKLGDTKYYEELTGYVRVINAIVGLIASLVAVYNMQNSAGAMQSLSSLSTAYPILGEVVAITSSLPYRTLSTMYNAYKLYDDSRRAEEALEALKEKSKNDIDKINKKLESNRRRKMMESYRAEEQILTGTSNIVSEYAMSAFASPTSSFDPEMTIAANYGYEYSGDNIMDFIPEFTTDYNSLAGGSKYINKILYKI